MNLPSRSTLAFVALALVIARSRASAAPGELDPDLGGFGTAGRIQSLGVTANAIAIDAQGRLVLAGASGGTFAVQRRSGPRFSVVENVTFPIDGAQESAVARAVAIAPDGRIVVAGSVTRPKEPPDFAIARLTPDLNLDTTFAGDGTTSSDFDRNADNAYAVAVQSDDKIVVAGSAIISGTIYTDSDWAVERFNENGTLDGTFSGNGKWTYDTAFAGGDQAFALALQGDGKILVGGGTPSGTRIERDMAVARINPNGSMDDTFDGDGFLTTSFGSSTSEEFVTSIALAPDGKIVVAGRASDTSLKVVRYLTTGALDATFSGDGRITEPIAGGANPYAVIVQPDYKVVVAGRNFLTGAPDRFVLVRYGYDGALDGTFGAGGKVFTTFDASPTGAAALALQSDGFLVAAGGAQAARYRWDGTLDGGGIAALTFARGHVGSEVTALGVQADGKLVAAGIVTRADSDMALARFQPSYRAGLDTGFGTDTPQTGRTLHGLQGQIEEPRALAFQADGKPVVAGRVAYTSDLNFLVARFGNDGTPDIECSFVGFTAVDFAGGDDTGSGVAIGGNRIFAAGTVRGATGNDYGVVRLAPGCTVDQTRGPAFPPRLFRVSRDLGYDEQVGGMVLQGSAVVVAGTSANDIVLVRVRESVTGIVQLDGYFGTRGRATLDTGGAEVVTGLRAQPDGRLIVSGWVDRGSTSDFLVAQFTSDGVLDPTFGDAGVAVVSFNAVDKAYGLAVRDDGAIAVAGCTTTGSGNVFAVAQLTAAGRPDFAFGGNGKATVRIGPDGADCAQAVTFVGPDRLVVGGYGSVFGIRNFALAALQASPRDGGTATTTTLAASTTTTTTTVTGESSTTTTTTATGESSTTTTTSPPRAEVCGNCVDDDGDDRTDFEDPACCPQAATAALTVRSAGIIPKKTGTALTLRAALDRGGLAAGTASTQDVYLQMRGAGSEVLCARMPASTLTRRKTILRFRDKRRAVASAAGIDALLLRARKNRIALAVAGRLVSLASPGAGAVRITFALRDPATAEVGNVCASAQTSLKADRTGALRGPR